MEFQKFVEVIKNEFEEIAQGKATEQTVIQEVISLNSMNVAILLTTIELEYDTLIDVVQLKECKYFSDLFNLINKKDE